MAISAETIMEVVNDYYANASVFNWHGLEVTCKKVIDVENMEKMVEICAQTAFNEDGSYSYVGADVALRVLVIRLFTNIELPSDIEDVIKIAYMTDLYTTVISHISQDQIDCIITAIEKSISHSLKINENSYIKQVNDVINMIDNFGEKYDEMFSGIDSDDIKNMVTSLTSHEITEEGIVNAFINKQTEK